MPRRWFSTLAIVAALLFVLAACGTSSPADGDSPPGSGPEEGNGGTGDGNGDGNGSDDGSGGVPGEDDGDENGGGDGGTPGTVTKVGVVNIVYPESFLPLLYEASFLAAFYEVDPTSTTELIDEMVAVSTTRCELLSAADLILDEELPEVSFPVTGSLISAGSPLALRAGDATLHSIPRGTDGMYFDTFESKPPAGFSIRIPGEDFPSFPGVTPPPEAREVQMTNALASGNTVTASTAITWEPQPVPDTMASGVLFIMMIGDDFTDPENVFGCTAPDNGSMGTVTDNIIAEFGAGFEAKLMMKVRTIVDTQHHPEGDAVMITMSTSQAFELDFSDIPGLPGL